MGYYTDYNLIVRPRKNGIYFKKDTISALNDAIYELGVFEGGSFEDAGWYAYAKWYNHEKDMIELSEKFPDAFFELTGDGEESDDLWAEYFCGGRHQHCSGSIIYEEPDMDALIGEDDFEGETSIDDSEIESLLKCV